MPFGVAKGVDYYPYSDSEDTLTTVAVPKISDTHGPEANFTRPNMQIQSRNIPGGLRFTGRLEWVTKHRGVEVARQRADISSRTGNIQRGTMGNMFNTPPHIGETTVCWGFYDAGSGKISGLTNQHQLYIYATRDQRRWMSELAASDSRIARGPFARFALPGSHDAGMFDMRAVRRILRNPALNAGLIAALHFIPLGHILIRALGPRAIANLSMTQKDNIRTQLDIGTRYFDFRPGTMHVSLAAFMPGVRYQQHKVVPGYPYIEFLEDVLRWLDANPGEIVVVSANTQGFVADAMRPSAADVQKDLHTALARVKLETPIDIGGKPHLQRSYDELIAANTRLIFLNQIEGETRKYDSYSDAHHTLNPADIIGAFEKMQRQVPDKQDYVVMQMQATATAIDAVVAASVITTSDASSPLLATKAMMDNATNPWLRRNAASRLPPDHLLVLLNDFVDNCMVETAIKVTEQRARD